MGAHDPVEEDICKLLKCSPKDVKKSVKKLVGDVDELHDRIRRLKSAIERCESRSADK